MRPQYSCLCTLWNTVKKSDPSSYLAFKSDISKNIKNKSFLTFRVTNDFHIYGKVFWHFRNCTTKQKSYSKVPAIPRSDIPAVTSTGLFTYWGYCLCAQHLLQAFCWMLELYSSYMLSHPRNYQELWGKLDVFPKFQTFMLFKNLSLCTACVNGDVAQRTVARRPDLPL